MAAPKIRADYQALARSTSAIDAQAGASRQTVQRLHEQLAVLEGGDWVGKGAQAFYAEMRGHVLPALRRLEQALAEAGVTTRRIQQLMEQAEAEAAACFRLEGAPGRLAGAGLAAAFFAGGGNGDVHGDVPNKASTDPKHPTVSGGTPFAQGAGDADAISPNDVTQGQLADCYLLASLAAVAQTRPDLIRDMIKANPDGSYTVTFSIPIIGPPRFVYKHSERVTSDFPADGSGGPKYAGYGDNTGDGPEIWVPLVEKAYAQMNGGYGDIDRGRAVEAVAVLTGQDGFRMSADDVSFSQLADKFDKGYAILAGTPQDKVLPQWAADAYGVPKDLPDVTDTHPRYQSGELVPDHVFYVTNVNRADKTVTVRNPWGWGGGEVVLTMEEFNDVFDDVAWSATK